MPDGEFELVCVEMMDAGMLLKDMIAELKFIADKFLIDYEKVILKEFHEIKRSYDGHMILRNVSSIMIRLSRWILQNVN